MVRLVLSDGRTVSVSPGHPTTDGRTVGELERGDHFDGAAVTSVERVPYTGSTYDILPDSSSAAYWADGIPLRSTLA